MRRLALLGGGCSLGIFLAQYLLPPALCLPGAGLCLALTALAVFLLRRTDLPRRRALLLGCALALLPAVLPTLPAALRPVLLGLCFGGLSHVLLDMLTPAGVPLTPFSRKHKLSLKLCATGSLGEYLFLTGVLAVGWLFWGKDLLRLLG